MSRSPLPRGKQPPGKQAPPTPPRFNSSSGTDRGSGDDVDEAQPKLGPPKFADDLGTLGRYRMQRLLGRGGMGFVYLAHDPDLDREVAIKVMMPSHDSKPSARDRFIREARLAAKIRSDHVVNIFQVGEENGLPLIVMEYLRGRSLDQCLKEGRRLTVDEVVRIGRETALGLQAAHALGMVHRDIKPANIWLEDLHAGSSDENSKASALRNYRVKILDFGLARRGDDNVQLTQAGAVVGTPAHMPPEQARGETLDHRADLFSLGTVLYWLVTGRLPFTGSNTMGVLMSILMDAPPAVQFVNPQVPDALARLIEKLLAKDPAERYQTAQEVVRALEAVEPPRSRAVVTAPAPTQSASDLTFASLEDSDTSTDYEPTPKRRGYAKKKAASHAGLWIGLGVLAVAAVGLLAFMLLRSSKGTLVVESDDPDAGLLIKRNGKVIFENTRQRSIELESGDYTVELVGANAGSRLSEGEFNIAKNSSRTIRIVNEKAAITGGNPKDRPKAGLDAERKLAEWVLNSGGTVEVQVAKNDPMQVLLARDLPAGSFKLTRAILGAKLDAKGFDKLNDQPSLEYLSFKNTPVTDAMLSPNLHGMNHLTQLELGHSKITNNGLEVAHRIPKLHSLWLESCSITSAGIELHVAKLTRLQRLFLNDIRKIDDDGMQHLKGLVNLIELSLNGTGISDAGLKHLHGLTKLGSLDLRNTKVTPEGAKELATALPRCRISHIGGVVQPKGN